MIGSGSDEVMVMSRWFGRYIGSSLDGYFPALQRLLTNGAVP